MEPVELNKIKAQTWKFFFLLLAWPLYLFLLPLAFAKFGYLSILVMVFPGLFLFTWVGYLMHESWHKYIPNFPSGFFYHAFATMLFTDPQIYNMIHGSHHANVNTWQDVEFHPLGQIKNNALLKVYHFFEIVFGILFLSLIAMFVIPRHPAYKTKYKFYRFILALCSWAVFFGGIGMLSVLVFHLQPHHAVVSFLTTILISSFFLHQSQLVEHGNLIVPGEWNVRNAKTRNLSGKGLWEKVFLFFTHGDSREHVLHHTQVRYYLRPFPGTFPLPENATVITLKDHVKILGDMLAGRESKF